MRQVLSRVVIASGLLTLACATAMEEGPLNGDLGDETGGTSSVAGSLAVAGTTSSISGASSSAGTTSSSGGTKANAFGGTGPTLGGAGGSSSGGTGSGGAAAGASSGGKAGTASGGNATAGTASGGKGNGGGASGGSGGSGTAGSTSATCSGVADWNSQKVYVLGDIVAATCGGAFPEPCVVGQKHKFECNPMAGSVALPWCQSREPGVGNGWGAAWVDKGQCQ